MYEDLKFQLCCGARALFRAGLSVRIAGHLSIKVGPNTMVANRFGPSFGTVLGTVPSQAARVVGQDSNPDVRAVRILIVPGWV